MNEYNTAKNVCFESEKKGKTLGELPTLSLYNYVSVHSYFNWAYLIVGLIAPHVLAMFSSVKDNLSLVTK